jgi:hypothetical protein
VSFSGILEAVLDTIRPLEDVGTGTRNDQIPREPERLESFRFFKAGMSRCRFKTKGTCISQRTRQDEQGGRD